MAASGHSRRSGVGRESAYPHIADILDAMFIRRDVPRNGREQVQQRGVQKAVYSMTAPTMASTSGGIPTVA